MTIIEKGSNLKLKLGIMGSEKDITLIERSLHGIAVEISTRLMDGYNYLFVEEDDFDHHNSDIKTKNYLECDVTINDYQPGMLHDVELAAMFYLRKLHVCAKCSI